MFTRIMINEGHLKGHFNDISKLASRPWMPLELLPTEAVWSRKIMQRGGLDTVYTNNSVAVGRHWGSFCKQAEMKEQFLGRIGPQEQQGQADQQ